MEMPVITQEITTMFGALLIALPIIVFALVEVISQHIPPRQKVPLIAALALLCSGVPFYSGLVSITEAQAVMIFMAIMASPAIHGLVNKTMLGKVETTSTSTEPTTPEPNKD